MAEDRNHRYGSLDYKVIDKNIRAVLDNRSRLDNTVQMAMPFVKATTTIQHEFLGEPGNVGFTLGLHGINKDVEYQDMYSSINSTAPLLGYTYRPDGSPHLVYATSPTLDNITTRVEQVFDTQATIVTYPENSKFVRIPPPGITNATIGRNKNGLLASAQLNITIPSLIQLECLHRTFLVPGLGMVLEWGQQFAVESLTTNVTGELPDISYNLFPWADRARLFSILDRLARRDVALQEIIDNYVYPTSGQYMWMFGRVANFNIKSNSDGSFNATVKIVGPSEDAWAYSTTTTVVPKKDPSAPYFCASDTNSVQSYFMNTVGGGLNLKTLLDGVASNSTTSTKILPEWANHVIRFEHGNQSAEGEPQPNTDTPTADEKSFANSEDAYFMSWKFFVNVVINNDTHGVKAILRRAGISPDKLATIGLLLPYADGAVRQNTNVANIPYIDDPKESFVGLNPHLRSIDPSTLIIVNVTAAELAQKNPQYNIPSMEEDFLRVTAESNKFTKVGLFDRGASRYFEDKFDRGFLSSGVWVNHKAVVEAMVGADTIMRGISNLLERMNSATRDYWQLTLDQIEGDAQLPNPHSYIVIDANWRESSDNAVAKFIDNVHIFNKYVRKRTSDGALVGSDLIECAIDLSLPKRLFSQIATLGLLSPSEVDTATSGSGTIDIEEQSSRSIKISDPNDALAKMFGITSLSTVNSRGQSPDLTILPNQDGRIFGTCGKGNAQITAGVAGQGNQPGGLNLNEIPRTDAKLQSDYSASLKEVESEVCRRCEECVGVTASRPPQPTAPRPQPTPVPATPTTPICSVFTDANEIRVCNRAVAAGITDRTEIAQLMGQLKHESNLRAVSENLNYSTDSLLKVFKKYFKTREEAEQFARQPEKIANRVYGGRLGNGPEPTGDGWRYRGRGLIQITGKDNYRAVGNFLKLDLVANPDILSTNYDAAVDSAIWFWKQRVKPRVSNFSDTTAVTKVINGGTNGLQDRLNKFTTYIAKFGLTPSETRSTQQPPTSQPTVSQSPPSQFCVENRSECEKCKKHKELVRQLGEVNKITTEAKATLRQFHGLRSVLRFIEVYPDLMVASITETANGNNSNAFGASPGSLSIAGDLVMPGINGIRVGELFWVDRIPAFYKAFGAFQVMSIEDTIGTDGWKTKINARFNYLGTKWKTAMYERLK